MGQDVHICVALLPILLWTSLFDVLCNEPKQLLTIATGCFLFVCSFVQALGPIQPFSIIHLPQKSAEILLCYDSERRYMYHEMGKREGGRALSVTYTMLVFTDEGVYVDTNGKMTKDTRLQWGEAPTSVGKCHRVPLTLHWVGFGCMSHLTLLSFCFSADWWFTCHGVGLQSDWDSCGGQWTVGWSLHAQKNAEATLSLREKWQSK